MIMKNVIGVPGKTSNLATELGLYPLCFRIILDKKICNKMSEIRICIILHLGR